MVHRLVLNARTLWRTAAGAALALTLGCQPAPGGLHPATAGGLPGPSDTLPAGLRAGPHEFQFNGARLWYRVAGVAPADAPPVVFLHGGPGQGSAHFDALVGPHLEPSLRMIYFDQRGSGHSERPASNDYAIPTLVRDVEGLRQALGVPQIALVGHSFGGLLALEYAAAYPAHVSRLVFVAGVWDFPYQCRLRFARLGELRPEAHARVRADTLLSDGTRRSDCDLEFRAFSSGAERDAFNTQMMFPDPAVEARIDSVNAAHGIRNTGEIGRALFSGGMLQYRFTAHDRLRMPVLVIAGQHDGVARPEGLRQLASRLPNARFEEYEQSGHFVYLDEPERFARDLTRFLAAPSDVVRER